MKLAFRSKALIPATPTEVWRTVTDWSLTPKWMKSVSAVERVGNGPLAEGSLLRFTARGKTAESRVERLEPDRHLSLSSQQGGVLAVYEYRLEPVEGGTKLTLEARCTSKGWLWALASPFIRMGMRSVDGGQPAALARYLTRRNQ